ncbi:hypothetical protein EMMF5_003941 [Cystobasidiomycetes sp. EMM_F5]
MANKSDKRIAAENAAILRLLKAGTVGIHVLQWIVFVLFKSQRTNGHLLGYALTSVPSVTMFVVLLGMGQSTTSANGTLEKAGDDLSQPGLTQYMLDIVYLTWAAQLTALIWSRAWWIYALIPGYAVYKIWGIAKPLLAARAQQAQAAVHSARGSQQQGRTGTVNQEGLSRRQQKMQARYEKGDRRYQMMEKPAQR